MKFSFFMMPIHQPSESPALAFQRDIGFIHQADALGFDEFMIGEHHSGGWETMPAPEMALAMAAAKAPRIRLGTSVVNAPYHHPFHVAERIAFLDHLTEGRAMLGIGPSVLVSDIELFRVPQDELYARMSESADVIVRLLESEEPIDHAGRFWSFKQMRLQLRSYQRPRLPLYIASATGSDTVIDLAARHDMTLMSSTGAKRRAVMGETWKKLEAACARLGKLAPTRDRWRIATSFYLAPTREEAWADVSAGILREAEYFSAIGLKFTYERTPGEPLRDFTAASCAEMRNWCIGTPEDAIAWIERTNAEAGGIGGIMITMHDWAEQWKQQRSLDLFARYVMPKFRGHTAGYESEWARLKARAETDGGAMKPTFPKGRTNLDTN